MKIAIIGVGGIGSFYGAKLLKKGHEVLFVARDKTLEVLKQKELKISHPTFNFNQKVDAISIDELSKHDDIEVLIITTKSTSTKQISKDLENIYKNNPPYILSLQNGVENEDILCEVFPKEKVLGGLTRKIGAHIVSPGVIEATGIVETIIGSLESSSGNKELLERLNEAIETDGLSSQIVDDIKLELWKKLIINNGVNAICALLEIETGILMHHEKLSTIVYGLMNETASAAKAVDIHIKQEDVDKMFELIKNFDSIKPSMLVDREFNRALEIDEICGVVIKNNQKLEVDSPYTKTISYLLGFVYNS